MVAEKQQFFNKMVISWQFMMIDSHIYHQQSQVSLRFPPPSLPEPLPTRSATLVFAEVRRKMSHLVLLHVGNMVYVGIHSLLTNM